MLTTLDRLIVDHVLHMAALHFFISSSCPMFCTVSNFCFSLTRCPCIDHLRNHTSRLWRSSGSTWRDCPWLTSGDPTCRIHHCCTVANSHSMKSTVTLMDPAALSPTAAPAVATLRMHRMPMRTIVQPKPRAPALRDALPPVPPESTSLVTPRTPVLNRRLVMIQILVV